MEEGRDQGLALPCTSLLQSLETVLSTSGASYVPEEGSDQSSRDTGHEEAALNAFCVVYHQERRFSGKKHSHAFSIVLTDLVQQRIVNGWITETPCDSHMLSVLKVVRLLLRDEHFLSLFIQLGGLLPVVSLLSRLGLEHLQHGGGDISWQVEVIRELTSICQKLSAGEEWRTQLAQTDLHSVLYQLLHSSDLCVVQCSLCCLIQLAKGREGKEGAGLGETQGVGEVDLLFHMVREFDPTTQHLAADMLSLLAHKEHFTEHFKMADGVVNCLRLLKGDDAHIHQRMVNVLELLGRDPEMNDDIRVAGGIPLILSILQGASSVVPLGAGTASNEQDRLSLFELSQAKGKQDQVCYLQSACCTTLTQLAISDSSAQAVVQDNGMYVLASLIRPHPGKRGGKSLVNLQCHALRALRFLFSLERNRRILRRLFPPDLFESFIDVGHYQWNIAAYTILVDTINSLPESDTASLLDNIEALNTHRAPLFSVGKYQVVELLGAGAFGSVYKVRRKAAVDQLFAMKEIKVTHPSLGRTRLEREKSMGKLLNEVTIMKEQLRHPSVVHYYKTFQESGHLYIVMELLEGASLYEHVSSLREKGRSFTEEEIWRMFLQLVLALRYIHKEKHVVHRDLSASNVMIGADLSLSITDFGLAKQKQREMSVMNSVVGTMPYWSPELVQSEPYTEKVDIWASGCLLYLMSALQPPFISSNPLALATKIVECDYPALPEGQYSAKVAEVIAACLTKDPEERPDAIAVGSLLAGALMVEVDHLREQVQSLQRRLDREKEKAHKHYHDALRARRTSERLKNVRSLQNSFNFDEDYPVLIDLEEGPEKMSDLAQSAASNDTVFSLIPAQGVEPGAEGKTLHSVVSPPSALHLGSLKAGASISTDKPISQTSPVAEGTNLAGRHRSWSMNVSPNGGASPEALRHPRNFSAVLPPLTIGRERLQRSRKGSAGVVAMSPNRLKQISDPILQFMTELHKLITVTQAPPPTTPHPRRQLVELYKRSLFGAGSKPEDLKAELYRLSSESLEPVECLLGTGSGGRGTGSGGRGTSSLSSSPSTAQPKLISAALGDLHSLPSHPLPVLSTDLTSLNYQQLKAIIESVFQEITA